jgi:hypothetical protein
VNSTHLLLWSVPYARRIQSILSKLFLYFSFQDFFFPKFFKVLPTIRFPKRTLKIQVNFFSWREFYMVYVYWIAMNRLSGNFGKGVLSNWQPFSSQNSETVEVAITTIGVLSIPFASVALWESYWFTSTFLSWSQYKSHDSHTITYWNSAKWLPY